jgi:hypothetical protein
MIGFIPPDNIHTVRDYRQYSAIAILHTLQFTVGHALGFSVFTSRILATDLSQSHCNFKSNMEFLFAPANSLSCHYSATANSENSTPFNSKFISRQVGVSKLDSSLHFRLDYSAFTTRSSDLLCPFIIPRIESHGKHPYTFKEACLVVRYLAIDVLLSRARVLRECVYRAVA